MALVVTGIQAQSAADLVTAVNVFLATLVNPKINRVDVVVDETGPTLGRTYRCLITSQTGGGVIATPWILTISEGQNVTEALSSITTLIAANPAAFFGAPCLKNWYADGSSLLKRCCVYVLRNATGGASANWLPQ